MHKAKKKQLIETIVLATRNRGKIRELATPLSKFTSNLITLRDMSEIPKVKETGSDFESNAFLKAHFVALYTGYVTIADDSGLIVDALNGAPGVYSARYSVGLPPISPEESRDEKNIRKLLANLRDIPEDQRTARFVTVMMACSVGGDTLIARGEWEGKILEEPRGTGGFGYDPVFFDPTLGCTAAELSLEEKQQHSHRGKALRELLRQLPEFLKKHAND